MNATPSHPANDHPIPDSYRPAPGLLAGEYPGAPTDTQARPKLHALLNTGTTLFIDLTEAGEYNLRPYAPLLPDNVEHRRISIPDMGTPSPETMTHILDTIDTALTEGRGVYVHCFGGIGRTGTVVGCYLVRHGLSGAAALARIADLRRDTPDGHRQSPETHAQRQMVHAWGSSQIETSD
jgi:protein-tyrosine phosphatase